ncbi:hypothetical protein tb265_29840 [Gemmatimonadetes bacterium T265]|nr:hypothetical protein tb265_29840 [Gemmatimonadetes bacterium T265]
MITDPPTPHDATSAGVPPGAPLGRRALLAHLARAALSAAALFALPRRSRAAPPRLWERLTDARAGRAAAGAFGAGPSGVDASAAPLWDDRFELLVEFEVAPPQGERWHRPYVAVWVEDPAGTPVRTLSLWVNTTGRGPRYIRELTRWVDAARQEQSAGGPDLVATVSSATRLPGRYAVTWDGRDDRGRPVAQGTYRVFIEAAREHGSYQLMQQDLALAAAPVAAALPGNTEIAGARVDYRRRA